ncbi:MULTISPECIES: class I SAM-dependent methyltransferase [unclassified Roseovarius]|uniref:class I SAM-dependent DNA methyltransferase n=1 Tax=unclassified Roseovarius TaxID=2614913 RepID=UPI00273FEA21|nr:MULTISPECIES: methyltransferase domain-containing protein [unclassified Roseovarius]
MQDTFLDKAYALETAEDTQKLYNDWAASYDAEISENGYATPGRVAEALDKHLNEKDVPILDFGCGTGLSGLALKLSDFAVIDGMDPNPQMLDQAHAKDAYRRLTLLDLEDETPIEQGSYAAIAAIGVIGTGAAPASTLDLLMNALNPGGMLAFSLNDHALADHQYPARLNQWLDCGAARLLFQRYGPHLPKQGIKCNVYVIEKA